MHPKLSIITVVKNGMPFVEQTIESVLGQNYGELEYIVIDGQSTDGTVDVITSHESKIAKWVSEKDSGIADAFNKGLSLATGEYIMFLNADDALAGPNVLQDMAELIIENEFPALIYGDYNILKRNSGEFMYHGVIKFSNSGLIHGQVLPHPCLLTRRSYFEKYGGFDPNFRIAMDYEWLLRGALVERIVHVPFHVSNIRDGGVSTLDHGRVVGEIIAALKKNQQIRSWAGEYKLRGYFFTRSLLRKTLSLIGLYRLFFAVRHWYRNG